ncbi:MAG: PaeR7I family type II restriction endonuclease [Planctomycetota bacterium]
MDNLNQRLAGAISHFWRTRREQEEAHKAGTETTDRGRRQAVTGGAQMDGVIELMRDILIDSGLPDDTVFHRRKVTVPGFYRPTKEWDLLAVVDGHLIASIEFKSQVGPSFGNNYNNRAEEALGNAKDLWTAYEKGAFNDSPTPWLGYFMLLEDASDSQKPVSVKEPHFPVLPEFKDASYAERYELLCRKLVRERVYNAACLVLSDREKGLDGHYSEPCKEVDFQHFVASLEGKATEHKHLYDRNQLD